MEIGEIRKRILDDVLLRIFNERARLALEIGRRKKEEAPVYDRPGRSGSHGVKGDNPGRWTTAPSSGCSRGSWTSRGGERIKSQGNRRRDC